MAYINNNIIVYQHIRLDTNEIFYIGIGSEKRAYTKYKRNKYWKNIVNKSNYKIEILHKDLTWDEACKIEIELISKYGRKNNNTGILCNMTDGGDGQKGVKMPEDLKLKLIKINTGNKYNLGREFSEEHKQKLSLSHKDKIVSKETRLKMQEAGSKIILNLETGIYYYGYREASEIHNMKEKTLWNNLSGISKNKTNLILT